MIRKYPFFKKPLPANAMAKSNGMAEIERIVT
jgi:hypothetical protein